MTQEQSGDVHVRQVQRRDDSLLESGTELVGNLGRLGLGVLMLPLRLLPTQTRGHMHNAVRELSYAFARLPGDFAEMAGVEIEQWARETEQAADADVAKRFAAAPAPSAPAPKPVTPPAPSAAAPAPSAPAPKPVTPPAPSAAAPAPSAPAPKPVTPPAPSAAAPAPSAPETKPATPPPAPAAAKPATPPPAPVANKPATPPPAPAGNRPTTTTGHKPVTPPSVAKPATPPPAAAKPATAAPAPAAAKPATAAPAVAVSTGVTIAHIEYDPPGNDVEGEYVRISNTTDRPVEVTGWTLQDNDKNHTFIFPKFTLAPGAEVKVWTRRGSNDSMNLYWGNLRAIWNNTGDTGILLDSSGSEVSRYSYEGKK